MATPPPPPTSPQQPTPRPIAFPTLVSIIVACVFVLGCTIAFLVLWLSRRRTKTAAHRRRRDHLQLLALNNSNSGGEEAGLISSSSSEGGSSDELRPGFGPRKLQKACSIGGGGWSASFKEKFSYSNNNTGPRHKSVPLIPRVLTGQGFGRSTSCKWPPAATGEQPVVVGMGVCRGKPSWIDEDALHGPKVSGFRPSPAEERKRKKKKKTENRRSWPLRNRAPTLSRLHHTIHGYPGHGRRDEEVMVGEVYGAVDYGQLRAFSRVLPEPPKPVLVATRDRRVVRPSVIMGHVYAQDSSRVPRPCPSPAASPVRSLPRTPSRPRARQQSTDSTLSDILRSTEKRLRAGSISELDRDKRLTASPTRVLGPREYGVPASQIRTPSPRKGQKRKGSQQSVSSETDSLVGEEVLDAPSGLTSPSRNPPKQEPTRQLLQVQSARTSISSELSALYSEDEMPDEVRKAITPLEGFVVRPPQATSVRPPSMNGPFVTTPLPLSTSRASVGHALGGRQYKAQDLFRESLERSQRLRRMTLGQQPVQSQGLILAPDPVTKLSPAAENLRSRRVSVTIPSSMQPYLVYPSRVSEPPPSPTRQPPSTKSPKGPLFLRVTKIGMSRARMKEKVKIKMR